LTVVSATQLKITSPAHAAGAVDVQVTTPGGTSAVATADKYTYAEPPTPTITAVSPASGPIAGATMVTVTGSKFTGATKATFAGTAGTAVTVVSATQLKITSPAHAAGAVDIPGHHPRRHHRRCYRG
jgi:kynureninase